MGGVRRIATVPDRRAVVTQTSMPVRRDALRSLSPILASVCTASLLLGCVGGDDESLPELTGSGPLELESAEGLARLEVRPLDADVLRQGRNRISVHVTPSEPGAEVTLSGASAFMPAHGHGLDADIQPASGGDFEVGGLDFFMPGRWEITLRCAIDGAPDEAVFAAEVH
jgi:hypothetical protein